MCASVGEKCVNMYALNSLYYWKFNLIREIASSFGANTFEQLRPYKAYDPVYHTDKDAQSTSDRVYHTDKDAQSTPEWLTRTQYSISSQRRKLYIF